MLFKKKRDSGLVEEFNKSVDAMDSQAVEIWNNMAGFEFSVWKNPSRYDKKQRDEIQVSLDKARKEAREFVHSEILFKDTLLAADNLMIEDQDPESGISTGDIMDMFDELDYSYGRMYARYLTLHAAYQTFVQEYKLPQLELIKECKVLGC